MRFRKSSPSDVGICAWKHTLLPIEQPPLMGWRFSSPLGRFPEIGSAEYLRVLGLAVTGIDALHNKVLPLACGIVLLGFVWVQSAWTQARPANVFWLFGGLAKVLGREAMDGPA